MDNVTHGLWGLGIYAGWIALAHAPDTSGLATGVCIAAIVGSEAPDLDYVVRILFGQTAYLRQHRAISHSIPMWFVWPLLISLLLLLGWPGHFGLFYLIALIAVFIHVGLDVLTTYGTQALWPFSRRRWALDVLFIVDAVMLLSGLLGLALVVFGVWTTARAAFIIGSIVIFYLAGRFVQAAFLYDKVRKSFPSDWTVSTIPGPLPWMWSFVAQSEKEMMTGNLTVTGEVRREIHWLWQERDEQALHFATRFSRVGAVFHWFARHLIWAESRAGDLIRISFADVTYRFGSKFPFTAFVTLKKLESGRYEVQSENLRGEGQDVEALLTGAAMADTAVKSPLELLFRRH